MNRREEIVVACARQVVGAVARQLETTESVPWELEASLKALALAIRALDRAEPDPVRDALDAGTSLPEAFEQATGRPLDLRGPERRLRDSDLPGRGCPDERHS